MGRLPRLPPTIFEGAGVAGHQSLAHDHLAYYDLAVNLQQSLYDIVREHHALTDYRVERRNSAISDALRPVPKNRRWWLGVGVQCGYHHQPGCEGSHGHQGPQGQVFVHRTDPYKVLAVSPCSSANTSDGSPLCTKILYLDLPSDRPGADVIAGAFRCKPASLVPTPSIVAKCRSMYLRTGPTQHVLNSFSKKSLPYDVTQGDVSTPLQRFEIEKVTRHLSIRLRGGVIAVMYETYWPEV